MTELWLKFKDERGADRRVPVGGGRFIVGRHSESDLCIPSSQLSRRHIQIEAFAEVFVVSDCGSSNGTTLNDRPLTEPVALRDGDVLNLGGGVEIAVELIADRPQARKREEKSPGAAAVAGGGAAGGGDASSIPTAVFLIAPALVLVMLVCGGGGLYFYGGLGGPNTDGNRDVSFSPTPDETPVKPKDSPTPAPTGPAGNATPGPTAAPEGSETPVESDEKRSVEKNAALFLQRIARKDPNAFLTTSQAELVNSKIAPLKGSGALADNLKAVKSNASQFQSLAQSKGLTPMFLAAAALNELGANRGNPLDTAKAMLPVLAELRPTLDNTLADDNLLIIAAYDQGKAGQSRKLQNILEALGKKSGVNPREIRTIWFLKEQDKITDAEYQYALRFLAIGTIMQNPKDFNVGAEAVTF
ncbi:MAG: FHA domain-containing protein [Acidobacteria bacterium]|nr:FHA domain-containing protein [Acidobacteriota bacterium]